MGCVNSIMLYFFFFPKVYVILKCLLYIGEEFTHNVVLVSGVQQCDSAIHIHIYVPVFRFFSHLDHYRILSRAPCATHSVS